MARTKSNPRPKKTSAQFGKMKTRKREKKNAGDDSISRRVLRTHSVRKSDDKGKKKVVEGRRRKDRVKERVEVVENSTDYSSSEDCNSYSEDESFNSFEEFTSVSSSEDEQVSFVNKKPRNCFGNIKVNKSMTYYRSNLRTCIRELKSLKFKAVHIEQIQRTPFWLLFNAIYQKGDRKMMRRCSKHEEDIRKILMCYDAPAGGFVLGERLAKVTSRDVQLILGIVGGSKEIPVRCSNYTMGEWIRRCFSAEIRLCVGPFVLYKNIIFEKLKEMIGYDDERSYEDVARLTHSYLLASFLAPNQNGSLSWHLTECVNNLEDVGMYDWCSYIAEMLARQIAQSKSLKAGGCAHILPYFLCEHTQIIKPRVKEMFPRFLKWDLGRLNHYLNLSKVSKLYKSCKFDGTLLLPTSDEETKMSTVLEYFGIANENGDMVSEGCQPEREIDGSGEKLDTVSFDQQTGYGDDLEDEGGYVGEHCDAVSVKMSSRNIESSYKSEAAADVPEERVKDDYVIDFPSFNLNVTQNISLPTTSVDSILKGVISDLVDTHEELIMVDSVEEGKKISKTEPAVIEPKVDAEFNESDVGTSSKVSGEPIDVYEELKSAMSSVIAENKRLHDEVSRIQRERSEEVEGLRLALKNADFKIQQLSKENIDLVEKLKQNVEQLAEETQFIVNPENVEPTATQFFENPETMAELEVVEQKHIALLSPDNVGKKTNLNGGEACGLLVEESIEKGKEDLIIIKNVEEKENEETPSRRKRARDYPEPSTISKRVKIRTEICDRKRLEITPQPSTAELIVINEGEKDDDVEEDEFLNAVIGHGKVPLRWDTSYWAVKKTKEDIKTIITECWDQSGESKTVWWSRRPMSQVYVRDIISLLHHERVSGGVIDSWADILKEKYGNLDGGKYTMVFSYQCWDLINTNNKRNLKHFVDQRLENCMGCDTLMFPMSAKWGWRNTRGSGDHWTLLKFNIKNTEWKFYNSMRPRRPETDIHLKKAMILVKYVEAKLREVFSNSKKSTNISMGNFKEPISEECLQQSDDSLDCGILVCLQIENTILKKGVRRGVFSTISAGNYRKKMVEWFVDPISVVV